MKTFLHVGHGLQNKSSCFGFNNDNWKEIRLDFDKNVNQDIVGTLTDMKSVETGSVDAVYSSHNIEHIFPHEVPIALREFYRVLKEDGIVVITCPDIQSAGEALTQDKLFETLYESPMGPVTAFDVLFGHRKTSSGTARFDGRLWETFCRKGNEVQLRNFASSYGIETVCFYAYSPSARAQYGVGSRGTAAAIWQYQRVVLF